jgi:hypothetical protein
MLEVIIAVLLVLWLAGAFRQGGRSSGGSNAVHLLLVIAAILIVVRFLQ